MAGVYTTACILLLVCTMESEDGEEDIVYTTLDHHVLMVSGPNPQCEVTGTMPTVNQKSSFRGLDPSRTQRMYRYMD